MATTYTFSPVTSTDRGGVVWVSAILSLMFSIITLAARFQIKYHTLGKDDWLIASATVVAIGQYIAIYVGLHEGLGQSSSLLTESYARRLGKAVLASEVIFLAAIMLSKLSVVFFMKRLFTRSKNVVWWCCNAALALTAVWGIASMLGVSVGCSPAKILYGEDRCSGEILRWELIISFDALLEVGYVLLATVLVWPLQMKKFIKVTVVFAFAFRVICAVFAALHGVWIAKYIRADDPGLEIADVLVWQQVALGYSLIATTIPTLKNFVRGYDHAMGWDPSQEKRGLGGGYNLASFVRTGASSSGNHRSGNSRSISRSGNRQGNEDTFQAGPSGGDYRVGAFHDFNGRSAKRGSSNSRESEDPIMRRVSITIEHEPA